jgi:hypothetical protein
MNDITNRTTLDELADDIRAIGRKAVYEIGEKLVKAKALCAHGDWLLGSDVSLDGLTTQHAIICAHTSCNPKTELFGI